MFVRHACLVALLAMLGGTFAGTCRGQDADSKALEAQLAKTLDANNKNDVKGFFADWAASVAAIANEMTYDALFKNPAKNEVADYVPGTIKLRKEESVLTGDFLVVYFDVEFTQAKQGRAAVNFQKENGAYKYLQIQLLKQP